MNGSKPPTETPAGVEEIDGDRYEYPYRAEDFDGAVIRDDLDTVPPFLNQEQVDVLAAHLEATIESAELLDYRESVLASVLAALPDSEYGRGGTPEWLVQRDV